MLSFDQNGIFCAAAGVYIDPWKPVPRAIITHAHSDHARYGMGHYLAHRHAVPVLRYRLGEEISIQAVDYGEVITINGVRISLHPAGHIWGSAQVRLEYKGAIWVVSGDYKLQEDGLTPAFEPIRCHSFVTESTFGLPVYRFPEPDLVQRQINEWWQQNREDGKNSILLAYALGKAQRVLNGLDTGIGPVFLHGAVANINNLYEQHIGRLPEAQRIDQSTDRKQIRGAMILAPPSALSTPWMRSLQPYRWGICSGWMQLRGTRRRRGADRGFVLSDHADWEQLNTAVRATGAEEVYVTHGYKSIYAKWLTTQYGIRAEEVETLYTGETIEETNTEKSADESF